MNTKLVGITCVAFILIATAFPVMRMSGYEHADLPAFGVLIMSMIVVTSMNGSIISLQRKVQCLQEALDEKKMKETSEQVTPPNRQ